MSDHSFDFLDTTENGNDVPLNERNILSLLESPLEDNNKDFKITSILTNRNSKKSYGILETDKKDDSLNDDAINITDNNSVLTTPFNNRHSIAQQKKRYISDISVYADLITDYGIYDNESITTNENFIKTLSAELKNSDFKKHAHHGSTTQASGDVKKGTKISELLVLGKYKEQLKLKEQQRKTKIFSKYTGSKKSKRKIKNISNLSRKKEKRKKIFESLSKYLSEVNFKTSFHYRHELIHVLTVLDYRIEQRGDKFDSHLRNSLYNVFRPQEW